MKKITWYFIASIVLIVAIVWFVFNDKKDINTLEMKRATNSNYTVHGSDFFSKTVDSVEKEMGGELTTPYDVFNSKIFMNIYNNPKPYCDSAIAYLSDTSHSKSKKQIVIYSMHKLDLERYLKFASNAYTLFGNQKIDDHDLITILCFPVRDEENAIVKNYKNDRVRKLLNQIMNDDSIEDAYKHAIQKVLEGQG